MEISDSQIPADHTIYFYQLLTSVTGKLTNL